MTLCIGDEAYGSHSSGANLWTFCQDLDVYYEVSVARTYVGEVEGVNIHRTSHLDERDLTVRAGVPCTTYERTLCDCTTRYTPLQVGRILDDGLRRHVMTLKRLRDCAERIESGPGRHMSVIHALLKDRDTSYEPGGSDKELDVLEILRNTGTSASSSAVSDSPGESVYRPDYAWPEVNAFAEYYGLPWHIGASAVIRDSKRVTALSTAGWMPLIFTKAATPAEIVEAVTAALASSRVGRDLGASRPDPCQLLLGIWADIGWRRMAKGPDLFAAAVEERLAHRAPLAARLRPRTLDEVVGQRHLLGPGKPLRVLIESDRLSSLMLWGPPGTGKTTIAKLIAGVTEKAFETARRGERGREGRPRSRRAGPRPAR